MVKWLKRRAGDHHGHGLKPTRAILFCSWIRHFRVISPAWRSWQAVLNSSHISIKLKTKRKKIQTDSNILASPEVGRLRRFPASQEDKNRDTVKQNNKNK